MNLQEKTLVAIVLLIIAVIVVITIFVPDSPLAYGALMGLASLLSPARIRREPERCIDCAKCTRACPALLPVDKLDFVRSAECTGCLECLAVCPARGALDLSLPARRRMPAWGMAAGIAILFLGIIGYAKWRGAWESRIPESVYRQYVPVASEFQHP